MDENKIGSNLGIKLQSFRKQMNQHSLKKTTNEKGVIIYKSSLTSDHVSSILKLN